MYMKVHEKKSCTPRNRGNVGENNISRRSHTLSLGNSRHYIDMRVRKFKRNGQRKFYLF